MKKNKILLFFIFIVANILVYYVTDINNKQRIKIAIDNNINDLKTHYEILQYHQKTTANAIYNSTIIIPDFINLFSQISTASIEQKKVIRDKLFKVLEKKYNIIKGKGILQYQFILPNNESFLRMHKPSKFGDDLTNIREDIEYVNRTKKIFRGFTQGRTTHGFRNTYPIFDKNGEHLGVMEISFSSEIFQEYLTNISKIHTHFIVNKHIFDVKSWKRDDLILKYIQSSEHKDFMLTINKFHSKERCIVQNSKKLKKVRNLIDKNIKKGDKFGLYTFNNLKYIEIISFIPIKDIINQKTLAWFVSYKNSDFIYTTLQSSFIIRVISFFLFLTLGYFIFRDIADQEVIHKDHKLLNAVLNSTDDIMFVTDFKIVSFLNRQFKIFFNIKDKDEFNKMTYGKLLNVFIPKDGYLSLKILQKDEIFLDLISRTSNEERIVCMLDSYAIPKSFNINITKIGYSPDKEYLVTLTDITKLKEKEVQIEKKAYIDGLTQVYNRNKFDDIVKEEFNKDVKYKNNLSIAIIDIDLFKNFNDKFGHLIGDEILIMLAQYINSHIRTTDTFARWGGEEFVILFPQTPKDRVEIICNKLRRGIENLSHKKAGNVTASFGVTQYIKNDTIDIMFSRCDNALYEAKENGRNKVCIK